MAAVGGSWRHYHLLRSDDPSWTDLAGHSICTGTDKKQLRHSPLSSEAGMLEFRPHHIRII
jgi:cation diffusion facilitator CzcD-associated flavoprotein CzcO